MRTLYKGKKSCTADLAQVPAMEKTGWSLLTPTEQKDMAVEVDEKAETKEVVKSKVEKKAKKPAKKVTIPKK